MTRHVLTPERPSYRLPKQSGQAIVTLPDGMAGRRDGLLATPTRRRTDTGYLVPNHLLLPARTLAEVLGVPPPNLAEHLARWRGHAPGSWFVKAPGREPGRPWQLYRLGVVRLMLDGLPDDSGE